MQDVFVDLYKAILHRKNNPKEGSYTCYLFDKGLDKILKKCGEECAETIIAAKNGLKQDTVSEISDLFYHTLILMAYQGITPADIVEEFEKRSRKTGNLKESRAVDKNS